MPSIRQEQVAEMIKRHFSMVLLEQGRYVYGDEALVTVTTVQISPDFSMAKVYLSVYNTDNKQEVILMMEEEASQLRHGLSQRLKKKCDAFLISTFTSMIPWMRCTDCENCLSD